MEGMEVRGDNLGVLREVQEWEGILGSEASDKSSINALTFR